MSPRQPDGDHPPRPIITFVGRRTFVVRSEKSSAQNKSPPASSVNVFEEDPPRSIIGHNASRDAFYQAAREAERLERDIAEIERQQEQKEDDAKGRLAPLNKQQILAAFDMAKLVRDGTVETSVMEAYVSEAGIRRHGNEKVPYSGLIKAVFASGEIKGGAPKNNRKRARASTYASAIDFALTERWSAEQFAAEIDKPRRKGERHGIEFLAAAGRQRRNAEKTAHAADQANASTPVGEPVADQLERPATPAEPQQPSLVEKILRRLSKIDAQAGNFAVIVFKNTGPGQWQPVRVGGPFSRPDIVTEAPTRLAAAPTGRSRPVRR
jgi:hypothetical protein